MFSGPSLNSMANGNLKKKLKKKPQVHHSIKVYILGNR